MLQDVETFGVLCLYINLRVLDMLRQWEVKCKLKIITLIGGVVAF
jgi:hypothetical protein